MAGRVMDWAARLAQRRAEEIQKPSPCKVPEVTEPPFVTFGTEQDGHPEKNRGEESASVILLNARCREACRGLPVSPAELLAGLNEADKQAMLLGDPDELAALRAAAECMAERVEPSPDI